MPTYAQLESEPAWRLEKVTPAMKEFGATMRAAFPGTEVWFKGDNAHLYGGHRSLRWIRTSRFCDNRSYTASHPDDVNGVDVDVITAFDFAAPRAVLIPVCQRLDAAARAGEIEELWEWYGNSNGDRIVDGWNNWLDKPASSDPSHLEHAHGTARRKHANNFNFWRRLASIMIGDDMFEKHDRAVAWATTNRANALMEGEEFAWYTIDGEELKYTHPTRKNPDGSPAKYSRCEPNAMKQQLDRIEQNSGLSEEERAAIVAGLAQRIPTADQIAASLIKQLKQ